VTNQARTWFQIIDAAPNLAAAVESDLYDEMTSVLIAAGADEPESSSPRASRPRSPGRPAG
jgi:hypothetical protein